MIIAVDFDGTLHDDKNPIPGRRMGPPMPGAASALWRIVNRGTQYDVFTVRAAHRDRDELEYIWEWLHYWKFPPPRQITAIKQPDWALIIDDRARWYRGEIDSWREIAETFEAGT
jgi:FMN phosphatase YigB (HAD superfamily)